MILSFLIFYLLLCSCCLCIKNRKSFIVSYEDLLSRYNTRIKLNSTYSFFIEVDLSINFNWISDLSIKDTTFITQFHNTPVQSLQINPHLQFNYHSFDCLLTFDTNQTQIPIEMMFVTNRQTGNFDSIGLGYGDKYNDKSILNNLKQKGLINYSGFGFLKNKSFRYEGELIFGDIPLNYIENKYYVSFPVVKGKSTWGCIITSITINNSNIYLVAEQSYAAFSTKHSEIKAPKDIMNVIITDIFQSYLNDKICQMIGSAIYCNNNIVANFPNVTIYVMDYELNLTAKEMFLNEGRIQRFRIEENNIDPNSWAFGSVLISKYLVYFDKEKSEIIFYSDEPFSRDERKNRKYNDNYGNNVDKQKTICLVLIIVLFSSLVILIINTVTNGKHK